MYFRKASSYGNFIVTFRFSKSMKFMWSWRLQWSFAIGISSQHPFNSIFAKKLSQSIDWNLKRVGVLPFSVITMLFWVKRRISLHADVFIAELHFNLLFINKSAASEEVKNTSCYNQDTASFNFFMFIFSFLEFIL